MNPNSDTKSSPEKKIKVFLIYSREDSDDFYMTVPEIYDELNKEEDIQAFCYERDYPGDHVKHSDDLVSYSDIVIAFFYENSVKHKHFLNECRMVANRDKKLIPIFYEQSLVSGLFETVSGFPWNPQNIFPIGELVTFIHGRHNSQDIPDYHKTDPIKKLREKIKDKSNFSYSEFVKPSLCSFSCLKSSTPFQMAQLSRINIQEKIEYDDFYAYVTGPISRGKMILLLGKAGSGKSTLLESLKYYLTTKSQTQPLVPILIDIKELQIQRNTEFSDLIKLLYKYCFQLVDSFTNKKAFEGALQSGKIIFLLDGLDKYFCQKNGDSDLIEEILELFAKFASPKHYNIRIIIASRLTVWSDRSEIQDFAKTRNIFELLEWDEILIKEWIDRKIEQMRVEEQQQAQFDLENKPASRAANFIDNRNIFIPDQSVEQIYENLTNILDLKNLIKTPILLKECFSLYIKKLSENKTVYRFDLLWDLIINQIRRNRSDYLYCEGKDRVKPERIREILILLAMKSQREPIILDKIQFSEAANLSQDVWSSRLKEILEKKEFRIFLRNSSFLSLSEDTPHLQFIHKTLADYLIALITYEDYQQRQKNLPDEQLKYFTAGKFSPKILDFFKEMVEYESDKSFRKIPLSPYDLINFLSKTSNPTTPSLELTYNLLLWLEKMVQELTEKEVNNILKKLIKDGLNKQYELAIGYLDKDIPNQLTPKNLMAYCMKKPYVKWFVKNKNLKKLRICGLDFKNLPIDICKFENLVELIISNTHLIKWPSTIKKLQLLKILRLNNNHLSSITKNICKLEHLQLVDLRHNNLYPISDELQYLIQELTQMGVKILI